MSGAFVKESEGEWLHDIMPTLHALTGYLSRENNGIRVYEKKNYFNSIIKREVHEMSNGLAYAVDDNGTWYIVG